MKKLGWFGTLWLTRLSKPAGERAIHRLVLQARPKRILELGLGMLRRTERMLSLAGAAGGEPVHYVGLDRFEGRLPGDPPGVTLKQAHQRLHALARVQLVPGNVDTSLGRLCNHLGVFDMATSPRHGYIEWHVYEATHPARKNLGRAPRQCPRRRAADALHRPSPRA